MSQLFLVAGIALLVAGIAVGLPAWRAWQARVDAHRHAERYAAWRGRGDRTAPETGTRMSSDELRRIVVAIALAVIGGVALIIGLTTG
jgi:uncharacterized membrane protein YphA (DoxX/SURF4 family)